MGAGHGAHTRRGVGFTSYQLSQNSLTLGVGGGRLGSGMGTLGLGSFNTSPKSLLCPAAEALPPEAPGSPVLPLGTLGSWLGFCVKEKYDSC